MSDNTHRIGPIVAKFAELWSLHPHSTFMEVVEYVLGVCHRDECARLMADDVFEALIDRRIYETVNGVEE